MDEKLLQDFAYENAPFILVTNWLADLPLLVAVLGSCPLDGAQWLLMISATKLPFMLSTLENSQGKCTRLRYSLVVAASMLLSRW